MANCLFFSSYTSVRQGEIPSPLLFSLFLHDLEENLTNCWCLPLHVQLSCDDDLSTNYVKLFLLLSADGTICCLKQGKASRRHKTVFMALVKHEN